MSYKPYMNNDNRIYHFFYQPSEACILFESIKKLSSLSECDDIISELTLKIEKLFKDVDEKDYSKKIDDVIYYPNGLIENKKTGEAIIASPWLSSTEIKEKKKRTLHGFNFFKDTTLYYELRSYAKYPIKRKSTKRWNLSSYLSKIELANSISEKDKKILKIKDDEINNPYILGKYLCDIADLFRKRFYLTDKNCKDLLLIYDTLSPNGENDYYNYYGHYHNNNLYEQINDYLQKECTSVIPFNIDSLTENLRRRYYCSSEKLDTPEKRKHYIKLLVDFYNVIYNIPEENFRKAMIKLKVIKEGYIPNIVFNKEEGE